MDARQLAAKMRARAAAVEPEFRKTTRGLGVVAVNFTRMKMDEAIYSQPIPTRQQVAEERGQIGQFSLFATRPKRGSSGAKKAWKRTKNLRRGERYEVLDPYTVRITNDAPYAEPRHEAGKPGRRKTRYPAHWRDDLRAAFREVLVDAYRTTWEAILRRGGL